MKKIVFLISIAFLSFFIPEKKSETNNFSLAIAQNKALADGEVIVGPFCAHVNFDYCYVDETGFVLFGKRY